MLEFKRQRNSVVMVARERENCAVETVIYAIILLFIQIIHLHTVEVASLNLDYYSDFEGETEIRFYTNPKNVLFKLRREPNTSGGYNEIQLKQGECSIYYFSMWEGYFNSLENKLFRRTTYGLLPKFLRDSNEVEGWSWTSITPELITDTEIEWLIDSIVQINDELKNTSKSKSLWNNNCIADFLIFLKLVKETNMELRVSKE